MARLNLTLDEVTADHLRRHAREQSRPVAGVARELLREALERREARTRKQQLAADYRAGRKDATALLEDLEAGQMDLLDDDEA